MSPATPVVPARVSEFFERKRRLAYVFAVLSMVFLAAELGLGSLLELSSHPRVSSTAEGILVLHRCLTRDNPEGSRLLALDSAMKLREEPLWLLDSATAALPEASGVTIFYGSRAAGMTNRSLTSSIDLKQKWDVLAAVPDPAGPWIYGWNEGKIVGRRRVDGSWGPEVEVARSEPVDRLSASGTLVAWRESGKNTIRTAVLEGAAFAPRAEFEVGPLVQHWDAVLAGNRILFAHYNRDDRAFKTLTFRIECCKNCPAPVANRRITVIDPILRVTRRVTGLALAVMGDRLRIIVSRPTSIMTTAVPLETFEPADGARLAEIPVDPLWRSIAGAVTPTLLSFFACSLVFLGFTLLHERARVAAGGGAVPEKRYVGVLPRAMALALDMLLLGPVALAIAEGMDFSIEDFFAGSTEKSTATVLLMLLALDMVYRFAMEWGFGGTLGKKILGLKVTEIDGSRLSFRGALLRNLTRIIDGQIPFGMILGIFLILKTERRQRLGDLFGRTVVVQDL